MPIHKLPYRYWTDEEDAFLRDQYGKILPKEIAKKLGRTVGSVRQRAAVLNLQYRPWKRWAEHETIEAIAGKKSTKFSRHSSSAVRTKRYKERLKHGGKK